MCDDTSIGSTTRSVIIKKFTRQRGHKSRRCSSCKLQERGNIIRVG